MPFRGRNTLKSQGNSLAFFLKPCLTHRMTSIYKNEHIRIEVEDSEIPWLKIFVQDNCKEMTDCDQAIKLQIWSLLDLIEHEMLDYFKPEKSTLPHLPITYRKFIGTLWLVFKEDSSSPNLCGVRNNVKLI